MVGGRVEDAQKRENLHSYTLPFGDNSDNKKAATARNPRCAPSSGQNRHSISATASHFQWQRFHCTYYGRNPCIFRSAGAGQRKRQ